MIKFETTRDELWQRLCLDVPDEHFESSDHSRHYVFAKKDWIDIFHKFCDEKEKAHEM